MKRFTTYLLIFLIGAFSGYLLASKKCKRSYQPVKNYTHYTSIFKPWTSIKDS